jgi:archaeal chaperonin
LIKPSIGKEQVIKTAIEVASMLLRTDGVIAPGKSKTLAEPPGGGNGGHGGYGGGMGLE